MEEQIREEFKKSGFTIADEQALQKCVTFSINYDRKPSDLVSSWEIYYLNRQLDDTIVQDVEMDGFLLHLQNEQKEAVIRQEPGLHVYSSKDVEMILNDEEQMTDDILGTPTDKIQLQKLYSEPLDSAHEKNGFGYSSGKPSKLITPFGRRKDKLVTKFSFSNLPSTENGGTEHDNVNKDDDFLRRVQPRKRCSVAVHGTGPKPGCRFMFDRIEDRFNAIEDRIKRFANALTESGLYEEPVDPSVASQRSVLAVGMITCDGEGHLNDKSVLLRSSVEHSGGQSVRLDMHKLDQFSIFPGQVVGIEGHNPSGHCLIASKVVDSIPLPIPADEEVHPVKKQALDEGVLSTDLTLGPDELSMIIAAGPFTTMDNLYFEPLKELLTYASRKQPQLLILLGPFVDSEHPQIKKGTVDVSYDDIFHLEVLKKLEEHVEYLGSEVHVILVPSIRDANHNFVFPQPPFEIHAGEIKHQITSLTNPGMFDADKVKVGCCSVDVLRQLSGEELSRNSKDGAPTDRLNRLANHILSQRSFYPLYPPAEGIPLDLCLAPEALSISSIPDIIILPSDMKYFIKVLSLKGSSEGEEQRRCVCVNPGRLAKGEGGGTFAELYYHGSPDMMNASIIGI